MKNINRMEPYERQLIASYKRAGIVGKTYTYLAISIFIMLCCGILSYHYMPITSLLPLSIIDAILWVACGWFGLRKPLAILHALFSLVTGCLLGLAALIYAEAGYADVFLYTAGLTISTFVLLSSVVLITKKNFRFLHGFLFIQFWILLFGSLANFFLQIEWLDITLSSFAVIAFSAFILYDTGKLVDNEKDGRPLLYSFELFMDLIGLFWWLLRLLTKLKDS